MHAALDTPRVVILGGGFGGLYTAVRLTSLMWPKGKMPQVRAPAARQSALLRCSGGKPKP